MRYLLDTHAFIWAISEQNKLSTKVKNIISNPENEILVSALSFWEISLKYSLGKMDIDNIPPDELPVWAKKHSFKIIPLEATTASTYHKLIPTYHKDPFDRMLIWEALQSNIPFISKDENVEKYQSAGLVVIW
jgi:PIN domain nuclease of toxin-antitoxin system